MADIYGKAVTHVGASADHREVLLSWYAHFAALADDNWQIKAGATLPAPHASAGDKGFVLEDRATQTINIAIADHASVGGVGVDGGVLGSSDDLVVGIDPSGGITDITSAGFTVGARWSGWVMDVQGATSTTLDGRSKVSSGVDWLSIRLKSAGTYKGGFFAGKLDRVTTNLGDGYVIAGGAWADWSSTSNNDHKALELYAGTWELTVTCSPSSASGMVPPVSTDGGGDFRTHAVTLDVSHSGVTTVTLWSMEGWFPDRLASANGAAGKMWDNGAGVIRAYNPDGGCWIMRDDQGDVE